MLAKSGEKLKLENGRLKDYELTIHYFLSYSNVLISLRFFFFFWPSLQEQLLFPELLTNLLLNLPLLPAAQSTPGNTFWTVLAFPLILTLKLYRSKMEEMKAENECYQVVDTGYYFSSLLLSRDIHTLFHIERRKANLNIDKLIK